MSNAAVAVLPALQFWQLWILFLIVAALAVIELPRLARVMVASGPFWILALAASAAAWALTSQVAPRTTRIMYDEQIYQHIGQNLADRHRAEMCNDGRIERGRLVCTRSEYNKQPDGYPHLLSVAYDVVGVREGVAWRVNNLCTALVPLVLFATTLLLFGNGAGAAIAAVAAAVLPESLIWGNTAAAEPSATLAVAISVLAAAWFVRSRSTSALAWMVGCTVYACQFRPESPLVLLVVAAVVACGAPEVLREQRLWRAVVAGAALSIPLFVHIVAESGQPWGTGGDRVSLAFIGKNLAVNGPFYLVNDRFPIAVTILAIGGVIGGWRDRMTAVIAGWFLATWGLYLSFYAGSYNYGADVRYSLLTYPPIAILAGRGAMGLARVVRWRGTPLLVGLALAAQFLVFLPLVRTVGDEGWQARADVTAAREFARQVPPNGLVLTHNPSMFLLWGVNAAQMSLAATDPAFVRDEMFGDQPRPVFFHDNFWCTVGDPLQSGFCDTMRSRFAIERVAEFHERTLTYGLYRVISPRAAAK